MIYEDSNALQHVLKFFLKGLAKKMPNHGRDNGTWKRAFDVESLRFVTNLLTIKLYQRFYKDFKRKYQLK